MNIINIATYKFVPLIELEDLKENLKQLCGSLGLKGTILLSSEGINIAVAGTRSGIDAFLDWLNNDHRFTDMPINQSISSYQPFKRMLVKTKRETITMRTPEVNPARSPAPRITPEQLKQWLDEGRDIVLLDTRNQFEVEYGTFKNALSLNLKSFTDFPQAISKLEAACRDKPIITFCTGGIRCEKAAPLLEKQGYRQVYQLSGGILNYFKQCGGEHFDGNCFVFDERIALDSKLAPVAES